MSLFAIRLFRWSHCSWWQSSFEPASPCDQVLRPAGKWNLMAKATCNLRPICVTRFHSKVYHLLQPCLEWNAVFLFSHSTHQQKPWRAWQILPFLLPGAFCRRHTSCQQTKHDHFDVKRMVQVKFLFISKKDLLHEFHWQATVSFLQRSWHFCQKSSIRPCTR